MKQKKKKMLHEMEMSFLRTLFGALCRPWKGKFSYSPGSVNGSPPDDLSRAK